MNKQLLPAVRVLDANKTEILRKLKQEIKNTLRRVVLG